ncbi:MAG: hypothetical protein HKO56_06885 [Bacteroidia bacterium]|nr:hypothetical protein [Bacteroidia bacterium]
MIRKYVIWAFYIFLIYYVFNYNQGEVFMALFALTIELIIILFINLFFSIKLKEADVTRALNFFFAASPMLFIYYFITFFISYSAGEIGGSMKDPFEPITLFLPLIIFVTIWLVIGYTADILSFWKNKSPIEVIENGLVLQGIYIFFTCIIVLAASPLVHFLGKSGYLIVIAIARIMIEYIGQKKFTSFWVEKK